MDALKIWFLDVGHGDCSYIELPNGARMMIDCGGGDSHWPSKMLKYYKITKDNNNVNIPGVSKKYGLDNLVITHPHGDHFSDITAIHNDIGFYLLTGKYRDFIDKIDTNKMDFRNRNKNTIENFISIIKEYKGTYEAEKDRINNSKPLCIVNRRRFLTYEDGIDLNEISWLVSFEIGGIKVLFAGDLTVKAVEKILSSNKSDEFKNFVKGTTILKVPHHGRENGCSQQLFDAFGREPLLCIISDEVLNERNEGTANTDWYTKHTSNQPVIINKNIDNNRKVLTTRKDKDIFLQVTSKGDIEVKTDNFHDTRQKILKLN